LKMRVTSNIKLQYIGIKSHSKNRGNYLSHMVKLKQPLLFFLESSICMKGPSYIEIENAEGSFHRTHKS